MKHPFNECVFIGNFLSLFIALIRPVIILLHTCTIMCMYMYMYMEKSIKLLVLENFSRNNSLTRTIMYIRRLNMTVIFRVYYTGGVNVSRINVPGTCIFNLRVSALHC